MAGLWLGEGVPVAGGGGARGGGVAEELGGQRAAEGLAAEARTA
jgi:hypothetical protein